MGKFWDVSLAYQKLLIGASHLPPLSRVPFFRICGSEGAEAYGLSDTNERLSKVLWIMFVLRMFFSLLNVKTVTRGLDHVSFVYVFLFAQRQFLTIRCLSKCLCNDVSTVNLLSLETNRI